MESIHNNWLVLFFCLLLPACTHQETNDASKETVKKEENDRKEYAMVIHGGAGTIKRENMTAEKEAAFREAMQGALDVGKAILSQGGSSMDAVEKVINYMEDIPLFNAGKGAVFTNKGENELDASIMNGADLSAGAVGGVKIIKNPISAARAVLEKSEHVLLVGEGAEKFAKEQDLEIVTNDYFRTESRWNSLQNAIKKESSTGALDYGESDYKYGTVGCVALDKAGNIVAGTSTGGMTNKRYNRIGDSPIIGAGTYANNNTCGVSCTGHGEFFIRYAVAHDVSAMMDYAKLTIEEAAEKVINDKLVKAGGSGGLVALDRFGNIAMSFNSAGMYRAYVTPDANYVGIYKDE